MIKQYQGIILLVAGLAVLLTSFLRYYPVYPYLRLVSFAMSVMGVSIILGRTNETKL